MFCVVRLCDAMVNRRAAAPIVAAHVFIHCRQLCGSRNGVFVWPDRPFVQATTAVPARPVVETCVALICIGSAGILTSLRRSAALAQGLALGTVSVGTAAILGYFDRCGSKRCW